MSNFPATDAAKMKSQVNLPLPSMNEWMKYCFSIDLIFLKFDKPRWEGYGGSLVKTGQGSHCPTKCHHHILRQGVPQINYTLDQEIVYFLCPNSPQHLIGMF